MLPAPLRQASQDFHRDVHARDARDVEWLSSRNRCAQTTLDNVIHGCILHLAECCRAEGRYVEQKLLPSYDRARLCRKPARCFGAGKEHYFTANPIACRFNSE